MMGFSGERSHQKANKPPITAKRAISAQGTANRRRGALSKERPQKKQFEAF
jgi:hypothetical protein